MEAGPFLVEPRCGGPASEVILRVARRHVWTSRRAAMRVRPWSDGAEIGSRYWLRPRRMQGRIAAAQFHGILPTRSAMRVRPKADAALQRGGASQLARLRPACNACATKQEQETGRTAAICAGRPAKPGNGLAPLGDLHMRFKPMLGLLSAAAMSLALTGGAAGPADRQDRRDLSLERQRRQRRHARQGRDRSRDRYHQQRPSRARQFPAGQGRRPCRPRRRQGRSGVCRQPGQPRHRPEPGAAPDHRREGGGAHRRLSVRHHADHERHRREIRHSLRQRRVGRGEPHRARLQMVLPHHADRHRLRKRLSRLPHRHEGGGRQDRQRRAGA